MISLRNINKNYGEKIVLKDISLQIKRGEYLSIIGESGSGKSTLLNIIGTIDNEYSGTYIFGDEVVNKNEMGHKIRGREIGFIFQQNNLIPNISVYDNLVLPLLYSNEKIDDLHETIEYYLNYFNIANSKFQKTSTLSGGEQQRVTIIRSILANPKVIIADEPTGNLDSQNALVLEQFLLNENKKGKTIILVTHDKKFALQAQRVLIISEGELRKSE